MRMIPVSSSNIRSIGYENDTLYIQFNNGSIYAYYNVPENVYTELMNAPSHGKYHAAYIKNSYKYQRIG